MDQLLRYQLRNSITILNCGMLLILWLSEFRRTGVLQVSITLETSETINRRFVHPSRRNSPTITKVYSDAVKCVSNKWHVYSSWIKKAINKISLYPLSIRVGWIRPTHFFCRSYMQIVVTNNSDRYVVHYWLLWNKWDFLHFLLYSD